MIELLSRFFIRRTPNWLDIYFNPGGRLRIQSVDHFLLWVSWGYSASRQFTANKNWLGFALPSGEDKVKVWQCGFFSYTYFPV